MHLFTLHDLFAQNLESRADHIAIVDGKRESTYQDLHGEINRLAAWLSTQGVKRGDRVVIHLRKSIEEVVATFAIARLGGVVVTVYRQWTLSQLDYVTADCTPSVLVTDNRRAKELDREGLPTSIEQVLVLGQTPQHPQMTDWSIIPEATSDIVRVVDTDLAAILYTSGSTGQPKGVMVTHLNLLQGARSVAQYLEIQSADRLLGMLELCFDYGLNQLLTAFLVGGTLVLHSVKMPAEIVKTIQTQNVTGFAAVPPIWIQFIQFLIEYPAEMPSLRYITNSGGSIPQHTLEAMPLALPGVDIVLMYGLTEAFRSTYLPPQLYSEKMGSLGQAIPDVEIFVIDEEIGICSDGQQGELVHRGSLVSRGYWNNLEATEEKIRSSPQLRHLIGEEKVCYSGDIVRIDEDGFYWFVGRKDSMMKCNGIRLSPTEVEDVLYQSGLVEFAVAYGVEHELLGQVVGVVIKAKSEELTEEILHRYCMDSMPTYMIPQRYHFWIREMPRTASGKIDRPRVIQGVEEGELG